MILQFFSEDALLDDPRKDKKMPRKLVGKNSDEKSIQNCQASFIVNLIHELVLCQCKTVINNEFI